MLSGCNINLIPLTDDYEDDERKSFDPPKIPIKEWLNGVHNGMFIDYDGFGCWATENDVGKDIIHPSDIILKGITPPAWATHVEWYNK